MKASDKRAALEEWAHATENELLFLEPGEVFDKCIVGIVSGKMQEPAVLYDEQMVIRAIRNSSTPRLTWEEAQEYFGFNTSDAWHGENTWRFVTLAKDVLGA